MCPFLKWNTSILYTNRPTLLVTPQQCFDISLSMSSDDMMTESGTSNKAAEEQINSTQPSRQIITSKMN